MKSRQCLVLLVGLGCEATPPPGGTATGAQSPAPQVSTDVGPDVGSKVEVFESRPTALDASDLAQYTPVLPAREASVPLRLGSTEAVEQARSILTRVVQEHGRNPAHPAVLIHGLLAMGPDLEASDGRPAIDALFSDWAQSSPSGTPSAGSSTLLAFPRRSGATVVEAHRGIVLKTLSEIGADPNRSVQVQGTPYTLADLYRSTLLTTWVDARGNGASPIFSGPRDMAWTLQGLSTWSPPEGLSWVSLDGHTQNLSDFSLFNFAVLHSDTQPLFQAQEAEANFQKYTMENGQKTAVGPFLHSCGAAHALQASAYAIARGHGSNDRILLGMQGQISNMFWRLAKELEMTDAYLAREDLSPEEVSILLVQQLKTTGHFLESMSKLSALGYYRPDEAQQQTLQGALDRLVLVVITLHQRGTLAQIPAIESSNPQLFMDMVNDSAHALSGLELALGERSIRY